MQDSAHNQSLTEMLRNVDRDMEVAAIQVASEPREEDVSDRVKKLSEKAARYVEHSINEMQASFDKFAAEGRGLASSIRHAFVEFEKSRQDFEERLNKLGQDFCDLQNNFFGHQPPKKGG